MNARRTPAPRGRSASRIGFEALRALTPTQWRERLSGDPIEAARWLDAAARYGFVEAQVLLGQILLDGRGVARNPATAFVWFNSAAQAGHVPAMNMAGRCLERGWGTAIDVVAAARWYQAAAERGLDWAQYNLANMLLRGRGVPQDRRLCLEWLLKAARQGHAKSMNLVGRSLEEGWAGPQDIWAALPWYLAAARNGDYRAHYNLGTLALQGGAPEAAVAWFWTALPDATPDLLTLVADGLAARSEPALRDIATSAKERLRAMQAHCMAPSSTLQKAGL